MKKFAFLVFAVISFASASVAQRYAVIDTKYILGKIPEYQDADKKLQLVSEQWQKEIDNLQAVLDKMYKDYDAEQFMLTDDSRVGQRARHRVAFRGHGDLNGLQQGSIDDGRSGLGDPDHRLPLDRSAGEHGEHHECGGMNQGAARKASRVSQTIFLVNEIVHWHDPRWILNNQRIGVGDRRR